MPGMWGHGRDRPPLQPHHKFIFATEPDQTSLMEYIRRAARTFTAPPDAKFLLRKCAGNVEKVAAA